MELLIEGTAPIPLIPKPQNRYILGDTHRDFIVAFENLSIINSKLFGQNRLAKVRLNDRSGECFAVSTNWNAATNHAEVVLCFTGIGEHLLPEIDQLALGNYQGDVEFVRPHYR